MSYGQTQSTLWGPVHLMTASKESSTDVDDVDDDGLEVSVHTLPKPLQREFHHVFPETNLPNIDSVRDAASAEFLAVPTNQRARHDLVKTGEAVEREKDRLLNAFANFARAFCGRVCDDGYWADFIDPCSGLPMLTRNCNKYVTFAARRRGGFWR